MTAQVLPSTETALKNLSDDQLEAALQYIRNNSTHFRAAICALVVRTCLVPLIPEMKQRFGKDHFISTRANPTGPNAGESTSVIVWTPKDGPAPPKPWESDGKGWMRWLKWSLRPSPVVLEINLSEEWHCTYHADYAPYAAVVTKAYRERIAPHL